MFYLFILESIGTSELLLIGLVALIVLGPRKLPQMARTLGKTMADFRKTTHEFRKTWEQEASFTEEEKAQFLSDTVPQNLISPTTSNENKILMPEIKQINQNDFAQNFSQDTKTKVEAKIVEKAAPNKTDWL